MSVARTPKRHTNVMSVIVFVSCLLLVSGNVVFAEPYLMLDANPATYVGAPEESIVTTGPVFTLYALVNSEAPQWSESDLTDTFYLCAAIVPKLLETDPDLGSYSLDGFTFDVVGDMAYGVPPIGLVSNPGLLPPHGIYETYYIEHEFTLDSTQRADLYNSQDYPGGPGPDVTDGHLYYQDFEVDATGLSSGYFLHFDLYTKGSPSIEYFAPFSHDVLHTPVPGAVLLGMLGLGVVGLKLRRFA